MRENRTYGSEGGEAKAFPTPIARRYALMPAAPAVVVYRVGGKLGQAIARGRRQFAATLHVAKPVDVKQVLVHIARRREGGADAE